MLMLTRARRYTVIPEIAAAVVSREAPPRSICLLGCGVPSGCGRGRVRTHCPPPPVMGLPRQLSLLVTTFVLGLGCALLDRCLRCLPNAFCDSVIRPGPIYLYIYIYMVYMCVCVCVCIASQALWQCACLSVLKMRYIRYCQW